MDMLFTSTVPCTSHVDVKMMSSPTGYRVSLLTKNERLVEVGQGVIVGSTPAGDPHYSKDECNSSPVMHYGERTFRSGHFYCYVWIDHPLAKTLIGHEQLGKCS